MSVFRSLGNELACACEKVNNVLAGFNQISIFLAYT